MSADHFHRNTAANIRRFNNCLKTQALDTCTFAPQMKVFQSSLPDGLYHVILKEWFRQFPRNQFLVIRLEDLARNPNKTMNKVLPFLGLSLKDWKMPDKKKVANRNRGKRNNIGPMKNETRIMLRRFYADHNRQLAQLLGDKKFLWAL